MSGIGLRVFWWDASPPGLCWVKKFGDGTLRFASSGDSERMALKFGPWETSLPLFIPGLLDFNKEARFNVLFLIYSYLRESERASTQGEGQREREEERRDSPRSVEPNEDLRISGPELKSGV